MKDKIVDNIVLRLTKKDDKNPAKKQHWYATVRHGDGTTQVQIHGADDVKRIIDFVKNCTEVDEAQRGWEEVTFPATSTYGAFTLIQSKTRFRLDLDIYARLTGSDDSRPAVVAFLDAISARTHLEGSVADLDLGNVTKRNSTDKRS